MQTDQLPHAASGQQPTVVVVQAYPQNHQPMADVPAADKPVRGRFAKHVLLSTARQCTTGLVWLSVFMTLGQILETVAAAILLEDSYDTICLKNYDQFQKICSPAQYAGYWGSSLILIAAVLIKISMSYMNDIWFFVDMVSSLVALGFTATVLGLSANALDIIINYTNIDDYWNETIYIPLALAGESLMVAASVGAVICSIVLVIYLFKALVKGFGAVQ